jgi:hypothetical protein
MTKNIFIVGSDPFNLAQMRALPDSCEYRFHSLIETPDIKCTDHFPVRKFLDHALARMRAFPGSVDAVVGYWDFPVSTILPLLRAPLGLPGPSLEAVLKCEHKYLSRMLQAEVIPDLLPRFCRVDPFSPTSRCPLEFPFWLKPVKSVCSHLGFRIDSEADFKTSLAVIRENIFRYAEPFNEFLDMAELPSWIRGVDGNFCIAESLISAGRQCTLEGYVHRGETEVYGAVDSIHDDDHPSCFTRYQYPSSLPGPVLSRMESATRKIIAHIGYDDSPFNIEFYWNPARDAIRLLEINTRISKSHCPLFRMVDGRSHHAVMIETALGRKPDFPLRRGRFNLAAKFMLRKFRDGMVRSVPGKRDVTALKTVFPEAEILIQVKPGQRLSSLPEQDSYSYEIGVLYLGADSEQELLDKHRTARGMLPFVIDPV